MQERSSTRPHRLLLRRRSFAGLMVAAGAALWGPRSGWAQLVTCDDRDRFEADWLRLVSASSESRAVKLAWLKLLLGSEAYRFWPEPLEAALAAGTSGLARAPRSVSDACGLVLDAWRRTRPPANVRNSIFARARWRRSRNQAHYAALRLLLARTQYATVDDGIVERLASRSQLDKLDKQGNGPGLLMRVQGELSKARAEYRRLEGRPVGFARASGVDVQARLEALRSTIAESSKLCDGLAHKLAYAGAHGHFRSRHVLGAHPCSRRAVVYVDDCEA